VSCVILSFIRQYCVKLRITQTTPHDSPRDFKFGAEVDYNKPCRMDDKSYPKEVVIEFTLPIFARTILDLEIFRHCRPIVLSAVNKSVDILLTADRTCDGIDDRRCYTLTICVSTNNRQLSFCVLRTRGDDGGRGPVLLTSTDDCHLVITLGVQLCIQCDGRAVHLC